MNVSRTWSVVLGIGLVILGLAGLNNVAGGTWIAWLDIVGGIISFLAAAAAPSAVGGYGNVSGRSTMGSAVVFVCVGLFAMWIIGLATASVTSAMAWWNFGFGCAYGLLAIGTFGRRGHVTTGTTVTETRDREGPRRAA